ncbi:MAG: DUF1232 domain-containing protein [Gemmatimonadetes bacterium]|nr:DUF1232 domain-containing protein [Gemmatimonadota bacterium]
MFRGLLERARRSEAVRAFLDLPWRDRARLMWRLMRSPRVPLRAKLILPALVLYLMTPIDIVPDFIPVLGHVDDVLVVILAFWALARLLPPGVVAGEAAALRAERAERGKGAL